MDRKGWKFGTVLIIGAAALAATAQADNPAAWNFVLETGGEDVFWTSPTAVDTGGDEYNVSYELTQLEVQVVEFPLLGWIDLTNEVDPNLLAGSETFPGPLPIVFANETVVFPEPPEPPTFAGDVKMQIDAAGFGQGSLTNITFGQFTIVVFGTPVVVTLDAVRITGSATAEAIFLPDIGACCDFSTYTCTVTDETSCTTLGGSWQGAGTVCSPTPCLCFGDTDCDGDVDFDDISLFVTSIGDDGTAWSAQYQATFGTLPPCDFLNGDGDGDGDVDFDDISPFVAAIGNSCE